MLDRKIVKSVYQKVWEKSSDLIPSENTAPKADKVYWTDFEDSNSIAYDLGKNADIVNKRVFETSNFNLSNAINISTDDVLTKRVTKKVEDAISATENAFNNLNSITETADCKAQFNNSNLSFYRQIARFNKQIEKAKSMFEKEQTAQFDNGTLPLSQTGNIDAMNPITIGDVMRMEAVYQKLDYMSADFAGSDAGKQYWTIDSAINRQYVPSLESARSVSIPLIAETYAKVGMDTAMANTTYQYPMSNFADVQSFGVTRLVNVLHSTRGFVRNIVARSTRDGKVLPEFRVDTEQQMKESAELYRELFSSQSFLTHMSFNPTRSIAKQSTVATSTITTSNYTQYVDVIKINNTTTILASEELPASFKMLEDFGIINGICTLKDIIPSLSDDDNVYCVGKVENGNYVLENRTIPEIARNDILRNKLVLALQFLSRNGSTSGTVVRDMSELSPMIFMVDRVQAPLLYENFAVTQTPLQNFAFNQLRDAPDMLTATNTKFGLKKGIDVEFHNVSFLPEFYAERCNWKSRGMISKKFETFLNAIFPVSENSTKNNNFVGFYFKGFFKQYLGDIEVRGSDIDDNTGYNIRGTANDCFTPVINMFNVASSGTPDKPYVVDMPMFIRTWPQD